MAIVTNPQAFAIMGLSHPERISAALGAKYSTDHLPMSQNLWLLVAPATAKEVCDAIGITDGSSGTGVVVAFTSYYGRANPQIWEWLASRMGAVSRG